MGDIFGPAIQRKAIKRALCKTFLLPIAIRSPNPLNTMSRIFASFALVILTISAYSQPVEQVDVEFSNSEHRLEAMTALASAKDGNHLAQYHIGTIYWTGYAGSRNYEQAAFWFRKSAEANYSKAQHSLSALYVMGLGVNRDFVEAVRLERLAALQGDVNAQYGLGTLYQRGYGVEKDFVNAYKWYQIAAENSNGMEPPFDKDASTLRDSISKKLSSEQLLSAKKLASDCIVRNLRECE